MFAPFKQHSLTLMRLL